MTSRAPAHTHAHKPPPSHLVSAKSELRLTIAGLMLALMLSAMDQNIVSTALPRIVGELGGMAHFAWVVTAFMLTSTITTPLYGKFSDLYGRKALFIIAISIFLLGSALCGLSQSMLQLIIFRAVQGLGAGGLITLAQTTIADLVPPRERGLYQGLFGTVFAFSSVAGPLLGGLLTTWFSWRWIFYVNIPVGIPAVILILVGFRRRTHRRAHKIDYAGTALLTSATSCLLLLLSWGGGIYAWGSPLILAMAGITLLLAVALVVVELRAPEPLLPLRLLTNKTVVIATSSVSLAYTALFSSLVFLPLFFQLVLGYTPARAGVMLSPLMVGLIATSMLGGRMVSRSGRYKRLPVVGIALVMLAFIAIAFESRLGAAPWVYLVTLCVLGGGMGFVMPNLTVAIQNAVEQRDLGIATAQAAFFRSLGGAFGVALSGALMASQLHRHRGAGAAALQATSPDAGALEQGVQQIMKLPPEQRLQLIDAYRHAIASTFVAGAVLAALAFAVVVFLPELPLRTRMDKSEGGLGFAAE